MSSFNITIEGKKYPINTRLTLGEYLMMQRHKESLKDTLKLLSIVTPIPYEVLSKIDLPRANYLLKRIIEEKLNNEERDIKATFEFKGVLYGLERNLSKINFGGWIDLETFISMGYKENLDKIVAIYYRPIVTQLGETYVLEEYDSDKMLERAELFKELPFEYVSGSQRFFLEFTKQYIKSIKHSLITKNKRLKRKMKVVNYSKKILPSSLHGKFVRAFIGNK